MANARTVKKHVEKIEHPNEMDERAKHQITVLKGLTKQKRGKSKLELIQRSKRRPYLVPAFTRFPVLNYEGLR